MATEPTLKEILGSIKRIVDQGAARQKVGPGLTLMVIVALAIAAAAAIKIFL